MATVSRQTVIEILDEVFDENLTDFIGRKGLVNLRNTILERMEEAGLVDTLQDESADDDLEDFPEEDEGYDEWDDEEDFSSSSFFDEDEDYSDKD